MRASALAAIIAAGSTMAQDYTITFRSLEETSSSYLHTNDSFVFDGTNSDIAQQLYIRHQAGDFADALELNSIPASVTKRLDPLRITFDDLPGLVQRALIWDSGFAISPDNDPVQIWTMENYTMASISVPQEDIAEVNCTVLECPQPNGEPAYSSQYCTGSQILNVSRCVADTFEDSGASGFLGVMWSTGGNANMTPHMRLRDHSWIEPTTGAAYELYAIHTVSSADDPTWNQCPANDGYSSLIVPCHKRSEFTDSEIAAMTKPVGSDWVTNWLTAEFAARTPRFNELLLIPIVLGSLVVVAAVGFVGVYLKRRAKRRKEQMPGDYEAFSHYYVAGESYDAVTSPVMNTDRSFGFSSSSRAGDYESVGSNQTFGILLRSPHLQGNRIPYDSLIFESELSRGVVWLCQYGGQQVAAKKLLLTRGVKADNVQAFAEEIELTASLVHPYIVKFVGVAWNNLTNLSLVLEYVPNGNLKGYLDKNIRILSWARHKIHIAIAIAEALEYLHSRTPGVVHRDLKSNNILLTKHLEPKLTDFGVSRGVVDSTMTSGVGTPYWTAPEVLEGDRYTEKSDIYSFGVVLSELDTGRIPYFDAEMEDGSKARPFYILQKVMSGAIRPSFSRDCPPRIQRIGAACLSFDSRKRPTARELVVELLAQTSCVHSTKIRSEIMTGGHTITLRSLETDSSPPSNGSFVFDGTHSDIARQLFIRHQANDTRDRVSLKFVPSALKTRLSTLNIDFDDLPGLVQRAVLWDTGFAIAPGNVPVQIWPMGGRTMANIAVKMHEVDGMDCDFTNCSQPNNVTAYYTRTCTGYQMGNTSHGVADVFEDKAARGYLGNMWARGGDPDVVPEIEMRDHAWTEDIAQFGGNTSFSVYVVHTIPSLKETPWSKCPKNGGYGTVSIPCVRRDHLTDAFMAANTTTPTGSAWVTTWLKDEFGRDESSGSVVIILIVLTVVALVGAGWFGYRRRAEFLAKRSGGPQPEEMRPTILTSPSALHRSSISSPTYDSPGSSKTLKILLGSVHLQGKRIPYDSLEFERVLSKGASGEVWLCEYTGQRVAVKKLLQAKTQKAEEVQTFAEEIELSASLVHPNIIEFLGVAWNTLSNLAMVLEFLPTGNLHKYLENDGHNLSWARHKIHMAVGVAQALKYLHACTPPLIHRDIKSSNILLTESLEPKIIDFGISRGLVDRTMTGGVGTPYWTAPEILEGERYTEQSDIYSFGVLLSELDTGRIPYHDALTEDGTKMKPFKVLHEVMSGSLRPSFSDECPPRIQRISSACLAPDPQSRPTAQELVQELEGKDGDSEE